MAKRLRSIFRREHGATLILVCAATLVAAGLNDDIGLDDTQVLAGLIALLAVDILIEKIGYLDRIENFLRQEVHARLVSNEDERVERRLASMPVAALYTDRSRSEPFERRLEGVQEVWVAGKGLAGFLNNNSTAISTGATRGVKFRFLLHDPNSPEQLYAIARNSRTNEEAKQLRLLLQSTIAQLKVLAANAPDGSILIKLAYAPLYNGYTIFDPGSHTGVAHVEHYSFRISLSERKVLTIRRAIDPELFAFHVARFAEEWKYAKAA